MYETTKTVGVLNIHVLIEYLFLTPPHVFKRVSFLLSTEIKSFILDYGNYL